jgi:hypothetical protein
MARGCFYTFAVLAVTVSASLICPALQLTKIPIVPAADWRQVESAPLPVPAVTKYGGDPAIEQEYGVKGLELRHYQLGKNRLEVVVEPASDPTAAYGLLTFYRTSELAPEKGVDLAFGDAHGALMARGKNFLRFFRGPSADVTDNDFQALLVFVGGTKLSASALDVLPAPLPERSLVPGSEKYLLGFEAAKRVLPSFRNDLVGYGQGAEVQVGQYQEAKGRPTVLVISYPTPQMARVRYGSFLGLNQEHGADSAYGRRRGSFVFLVLNAGDTKIAAALMDQFKIAQGVSWDQRYPGDKPFTVQLVQMILAIIVLTAVLICVCLAAGVIFFLSRRVAARFFPDWQWGHPDEDQLIRLNLKS